MCHCLQRNFFFFENAKIWVGRTTLNRQKKGDGLILLFGHFISFHRKFLQSLPDKGRKVSETVERLKKLIAQREKIEDTIAQFEKLTVSQLVQRTQLDALDSDDSENNDDDDDKMHTHSCTVDPASNEQHKEMTSKERRKMSDANKSRNNQFSSQSPGKTWEYESSATPPTYKLEVITTQCLHAVVFRHFHLGVIRKSLISRKMGSR